MAKSDVIHVRSFVWLGATMEVDAVSLLRDPLAPSSGFRFSIPTIALAEDAIDAVGRARAGRAAPAFLDGAAVASLELERIDARLALRSHIDEVTGQTNPDVPPGAAKEWAEGDLTLRVRLATSLSAYTPRLAYPSHEGEISFDEAVRIARTRGYPVVLSGVVERERYWVFPWRQIGSVGGAVEKTGGRLTSFGSDDSLEAFVIDLEGG